MFDVDFSAECGFYGNVRKMNKPKTEPNSLRAHWMRAPMYVCACMCVTQEQLACDLKKILSHIFVFFLLTTNCALTVVSH